MDILITLGATVGALAIIAIIIISFIILLVLAFHLQDNYSFTIPTIFLIIIFVTSFCAMHDKLVAEEKIEPFLNFSITEIFDELESEE